jgi:hypothetical protein
LFQGAARQSRNQRSADSLVRELPVLGKKHADKAVRAPDESSQNATKLGDSNAECLDCADLSALFGRT